MAVPQTHWPTKAVRIPREMEEAIVVYAQQNGYVSDEGEVNWGATLRSLLAFALDALEGTGLDNQLAALWLNAQAKALSHVRMVVMRALEDSKDEKF